MKGRFLRSIASLALVIFTLSCESPDGQENSLPASDNHIVTADVAQNIALLQAPKSTGTSTKNGKTSATKSVASVFPVNPDKNAPLMYIINYEGGGFMIVSGDDRTLPILAHSDTNPFPTDQKMLPAGLIEWLANEEAMINGYRKNNTKQDPRLKKVWEDYKTRHVMPTVDKNSRTSGSYVYTGDCNNGSSGYSLIMTQTPLTTTTWSQGAGFNELLINNGCSGTGNGKVWAGCVPVATAQIMYYYQYPSGYSWSTMSTTSGGTEASRLIRDIGFYLGMGPSDYDCDGSGAETSGVPSVLSSNMGYASGGNYADYNYFTVKNEVYGGHPVILRGGRNTGWWIFGVYSDGHAWVCDGLYDETYYSCQPDPNTPGEQISVYWGYSGSLNMNWGWGGNHNGYYSSSNWNPGSNTFNYRTKMITGIRRP